jgi:hypothetical protein
MLFSFFRGCRKLAAVMQISTFFGESLLVLSCMKETLREDRTYVGTKQIFTVSFIIHGRKQRENEIGRFFECREKR